jgi:hypothetical protein
VGLFRVWCKIFDFFPKEFVIVKSKNWNKRVLFWAGKKKI